MSRRIVAFTAILAGGLFVPPAQAVPLHSCGGAMCGTLQRALDPARPGGRKIGIHFRWYRAAERSSEPPIVAVEGGPGYPSTGSRVEYRGIFGPMLRTRDLLLVDNRGTGESALIDCPGVQFFVGRTSGSDFARQAGVCAETIDERYGRGASGLFATAYAVDDLAAVIRALKLPTIELYGDSYGGFFVQDFIARHPRLIRSVVLDSTYPRRGLDPWYPSSASALRAALEIVSPGAVARLAALLEQVRAHPIRGSTRDSDASALKVTVDARALTDLVQDSASDPVILRELDASIRAALAGDDVPLLRLTGQANTWSHTPSDPDYFSRGQYLAVACTDYPQLFDPDATPAQRRRQLAARTPPPAFAPFTGAEWLTVSGFTQPYDVCLDWPRPIRRPPPVPLRKLPASVPILIVGGDLDSLTPLADAHEYGPELGANVRVVTLRNTVHVTSEGDNYLVEGMRCARRVIRSFVRGQLQSACAETIPALHTPSGYPRTLAAAAPATVVSGPDPGETARRAATVAAEAFADAVIRRIYSFGTRGPGLRGGRFTVEERESGTLELSLDDARFVADAGATGSGVWDPSTGAVGATLTVAGVDVTLEWRQARPLATATIGRTVLSLPAP